MDKVKDLNELTIEMIDQDMIACRNEFDEKYSYLKSLTDSFEKSDIHKWLNSCYTTILKKIGDAVDFEKVTLEDCSDIFKSNYCIPDGELCIDLVDETSKRYICGYRMTIKKSRPTDFKITRGEFSCAEDIREIPFIRFNFPQYVVVYHQKKGE